MDKLIHIRAQKGFSLVSLMALNNIDATQIGAALNVPTPERAKRTSSESGLSLIGTGPGCWLAHAEGRSPFWADELRDRLVGIASVSDQSSSYDILRLRGTNARTVLQRGMAIDLHESAFGPDSVATSAIAHIGVIMWQVDDQPSYDVATFRSYAESFRLWLDHNCAAL